jgi:hypothetical protein
MDVSRYKKIDPRAFSDMSTWMNLGLWTAADCPSNTIGNAFTAANVALATEIARHLSPSVKTVVDMGCGRGDSLELWDKQLPHLKRIMGVNSSKSEYKSASDKFKGNRKVSVFFSDAMEFLERDLKLENLGIISVDALYHFRPDRLAFLSAAKSSKALSLACSDILLSEKWSREEGKLDFVTQHIRHMFLACVCYLGGIPRVNLTYGPSEFRRAFAETGWQETHFEIVTERVFLPFSEYCSSRAKRFSWFSRQRWELMSSGAFMRLLHWMQAVDFVIYAAANA